MTAIECAHCGAGQEAPPSAKGYQCSTCGAVAVYHICPNSQCRATVVRDPRRRLNPSVLGDPCPRCGKAFKNREWKPASVKDTAAASPYSQEELSDSRRRVIGGVVIAASAIPNIMPGVTCVLRFLSTHVVVMSGSTQSVSEVCRIGYDEIDVLEATGTGRRSYVQGNQFIGGGFGFEGAIEGLAVSEHPQQRIQLDGNHDGYGGRFESW